MEAHVGLAVHAGLAQAQISPSRLAMATASVRLLAPNLALILRRWALMVVSDTNMRSAMVRLRAPSARWRRTSNSRRVSASLMGVSLLDGVG
ncbi:hypothetical protein D3C80_2000400 [compost metagenome]